MHSRRLSIGVNSTRTCYVTSWRLRRRSEPILRRKWYAFAAQSASRAHSSNAFQFNALQWVVGAPGKLRVSIWQDLRVYSDIKGRVKRMFLTKWVRDSIGSLWRVSRLDIMRLVIDAWYICRPRRHWAGVLWFSETNVSGFRVCLCVFKQSLALFDRRTL